jgi:hypothetical protein
MESTQSSGRLLIAACGMNCGICMAYLRDRNKCYGCRIDCNDKSVARTRCIIKNCTLLHETESGFCYECKSFPCKRLKQLDKRYRTKYKMSMIENLENIKKSGLDAFIDTEKERWKCSNCGGTICVHRGYCIKCKGIKN